jgi:hypothetical protein
VDFVHSPASSALGKGMTLRLRTGTSDKVHQISSVQVDNVFGKLKPAKTFTIGAVLPRFNLQIAAWS